MLTTLAGKPPLSGRWSFLLLIKPPVALVEAMRARRVEGSK
jgi:hypothetical protein